MPSIHQPCEQPPDSSVSLVALHLAAQVVSFEAGGNAAAPISLLCAPVPLVAPHFECNCQYSSKPAKYPRSHLFFVCSCALVAPRFMCAPVPLVAKIFVCSCAFCGPALKNFF